MCAPSTSTTWASLSGSRSVGLWLLGPKHLPNLARLVIGVGLLSRDHNPRRPDPMFLSDAIETSWAGHLKGIHLVVEIILVRKIADELHYARFADKPDLRQERMRCYRNSGLTLLDFATNTRRSWNDGWRQRSANTMHCARG